MKKTWRIKVMYHDGKKIFAPYYKVKFLFFSFWIPSVASLTTALMYLSTVNGMRHSSIETASGSIPRMMREHTSSGTNSQSNSERLNQNTST